MSYENRFIAFLDILGFKNWVDKTVDDEDVFNTIKSGIDYISREREELYHGRYSDIRINDKEISVFSDSIVISYAMDRGSLFYVLMDLVFICVNLNSKGIFVRGAVTCGKLYHKDHECFGPAMVKAYDLEQNYATYPRIIVGPEVVKKGLENPGPANTSQHEAEYLNKLLCKSDDEDFFYLDYLSQYDEFDYEEQYIDLIIKVRKYIVDNIKHNKNNEQVLKKYIWFAEYYNKVVETTFDECADYYITVK